MTWRIGDNGYEMTLSARVPGLIEAHLKNYLSNWLAEQGETIESIQGWAVHPGGSRILSATQQALDLCDEDLETSRGVLSDHGNMSSSTMLFILNRFAKAGRPKPWVMLGFGPGLEIEVALIR
jgi:predicted naringenin-chalcone synthase